MDRETMSVTNTLRQGIGIVSVRPRPNAQNECVPFLVADQYVWRPSAGIEDALPAGFEIIFNCLVGTNQARRFVPTDGVGTFILQASLAGNALLGRRANLNQARRFTYDTMRLIYQLAPTLREHYDRAFTRVDDLCLPRADGVDGAHVIPDGVGRNAQGEGASWTPGELLMRGREHARGVGVSAPNPAACIRFGLLEAALRNPLDPAHVSQDEALRLVRLALFDLGPSSERMSEAQLDHVSDRFLALLERHLTDDTDSFRRWFFNLDNVVHAIAKKKTSWRQDSS
jgi:hypothetical protein